MNKIQYIELLKLRGVTELKGESVTMAVKRTGGDPTESEMVIVNENAMKYFINKVNQITEERNALKASCERLTAECEDLSDDVQILRALEAAGVDNWEGYDIAMDMLDEWKSEDDKEI